MDKFLEEYDGKELQDDINYNSDDVKTFSRKFRNYLKRQLPQFEIMKYSLGHYFVSGFLKKDGVYVYFSYNIPRRQPIDVTAGYFAKNEPVLYRIAQSENDYTGNWNHYTSLACLPEDVEHLAHNEAARRKIEKMIAEKDE